MKAIAWVKKLGGKLLGKKANMPAAEDYTGGLANVTSIAPDKKEVPLGLVGAGVIQLPEHWRN
jgi:hypothetical protein